jgi:hypothetical protein
MNSDKLFTMDSVVELRNAIRKELGFGKNISTKISWITYINWKPKKEEKLSK